MDWMLESFGTLFGWIQELVARYPIPAALLTVLSVASAVWTNHKNRAATIFGHSMQAITHLDQRWEAEDLRQYRKKAAGYLWRKNHAPDSQVVPTHSEREALRAVCNFLETVGVFVRLDAFGRRTAWQLFGTAAQVWVEGARKDLLQYRQPHATMYTEMCYLYAISRIEEQRITLPLTWLWTRATAVRLTWGGEAHAGKLLPASLAFNWNLVVALFTGNIAVLHDIKPLFSQGEILKLLKQDSMLGMSDSQTLAAPVEVVSPIKVQERPLAPPELPVQ